MYYKINKKEAKNIYKDAMEYAGYSVVDYVGYYYVYENGDYNIAVAVNKSKDDFDGHEYFSVYALYEPDEEGQWFTTDSLNKNELVNLILEIANGFEKRHSMYYWTASSNDGSYEDQSNRTFATKKEAYEDMRNAALEKMKWNTEFEEDFDDDVDSIDYDIHFEFSKGKITHESYSGLYTYEIKVKE